MRAKSDFFSVFEGKFENFCDFFEDQVMVECIVLRFNIICCFLCFLRENFVLKDDAWIICLEAIFFS